MKTSIGQSHQAIIQHFEYYKPPQFHTNSNAVTFNYMYHTHAAGASIMSNDVAI